METSLFQEMLNELMFILIVVLLLLLLISIVIYNAVRMSRIELDLEKDGLVTKVRTFLELRGFTCDQSVAPYIEWNNIDGVVIYTFAASVHWLTYWDRFLLSIHLTSVDKLNIKYCNGVMSSSKRIIVARTKLVTHLTKMNWCTQLVR